MTEEMSEPSALAKLLDNLWLQLVIGTGVTIVWLLWVIVEILFR